MSKYLLCPDLGLSPLLRMSDKSSCSEMIWEDGKLIDPEEYNLSKLEFICETLPSGEMTDYAVSDMGCSVVSERFKELLDKAGIDNIQYFEAAVVEKEGKPAKPGYYAANIVGLVDCIDIDASELDSEPDKTGEKIIIWSIDRLVLKDDFGKGELIFRTANYTGVILVDDALKEKISGSPLKGIKLILPERWDGFSGEL